MLSAPPSTRNPPGRSTRRTCASTVRLRVQVEVDEDVAQEHDVARRDADRRQREVARARSGTGRAAAARSTQSRPIWSKYFTRYGARSPRLTSSWENRAARARSTIVGEMSVPTICAVKPGLRRQPVQQQHRQRVRLLPTRARRRPDDDRHGSSTSAATSGSRCSVNASNGCESRNHDVSFVVSASTTASLERWVAVAQPGHQTGDVLLAQRAGDRGEPGLDQVLLARLQVDRAALADHLGDEREVRRGQGHEPPPRVSGRG